MNNFSGLFLDSGSLEEVEKWNFLIGGVTTNQVILLTKDRVKDIPKRIREICEVIGNDKTLSIELPDSEWPFERLIEIGKKYSAISPKNIVIKVPIVTDNDKGLLLINRFAKLGIRTNATIGMNYGQLVMAAEASRGSTNNETNFISLFWGRTIESVEKYNESVRPDLLLKSVKQYLSDHVLSTKIIVGSIRTTDQVREAFYYGADIVTIAPGLMAELLVNERAKETTGEFDQAFRNVEKEIILV